MDIEKRRKRINTNLKRSNKSSRVRLLVRKTAKYIYATLIATDGKVIGSVVSDKLTVEQATQVGQSVAHLAQKNGVSKVYFDRNGYPYHGRVKALADAARANGLEF